MSGCDAVFDTVGGDVATRSFAVLKPGGRAAFIASGPKAPTPPRADVRPCGPSSAATGAHLERVAALVSSGAVRAPEVICSRWRKAAAAHRVSEGRHFRGSWCSG